MVKEFLGTVYALAVNHRWAELREYFALVRELLAFPTLTITPGTPKDN